MDTARLDIPARCHSGNQSGWCITRPTKWVSNNEDGYAIVCRYCKQIPPICQRSDAIL